MKDISCVSCFLLFTVAIYIALVAAEWTSVKMEEQRALKNALAYGNLQTGS